MRFSRDLIVVVVLFAALMGLTVLGALFEQSQPPAFIPYSTHTTEPQGAQALQRWLEALGYDTFRIEGSTFTIPRNAHLLFVLNEIDYVDSGDADAVMEWVARGNTAIVVDSGLEFAPNALMRQLKQTLPRRFDALVAQAEIEQPLAGDAVSRTVRVDTRYGLTLDRSDYVEYLSAQGSPLLVSFAQGSGTVWLTSAPYLFTNDGLRDDANAGLVETLFNRTFTGSLVAFDEYHLGFRGSTAQDHNLLSLVYTTPWGWAVLYGLIVVFAYLLVNGQRLGRTMPLPHAVARRSPVEFVTAMAQLFRRAGKQGLVQRHYTQHLKRSLGQPYRINPDLPDDEFVAALARSDDRVDAPALARLLRELGDTRGGEGRLVRLSNQAINLVQRRGKG